MTELFRETIDAAERVIAGKANRMGDCLEQLFNSPTELQSGEDSGRVYLAALLDFIGLHEESARVLRDSPSAMLRNMEGMLAAAHGQHRRARDILVQTLDTPTNSPLMRQQILANLATVSLLAGSVGEAEAWIEAAAATEPGGGPAVDVLLATVRASIASYRDDLPALCRAAVSLGEASSSRLAELGTENPQALAVVANMASVEIMVARAENSEVRLERAIDVLEVAAFRLAAEFGSEHPQAKTAMASVAAAKAVPAGPARVESVLEMKDLAGTGLTVISPELGPRPASGSAEIVGALPRPEATGTPGRWEPALTSREAATLGIPRSEYESAVLYARLAVQEHQRLGTVRDCWEPRPVHNSNLSAPFIQNGERELASRLAREGDPSLDKVRALLESVKEDLDEIAGPTRAVTAPESGARYSVTEAIKRVRQHDATIEYDEAAGRHHHRRANVLLKLATFATWAEATGFLIFITYYLNVPLLVPWRDWRGWSISVTVVMATISGQTWLVRHAARSHNRAREFLNDSRHAENSVTRRRNWYLTGVAIIAVAITGGMIWRGTVALGNASSGTAAVIILGAAVTGLLSPSLAYLGIALDGSRVSRERDVLVVGLDDDLDAYHDTISDIRRDLADAADISVKLRDKTFPDICDSAQEEIDAAYRLYGSVRLIIGELSADPPSGATTTIGRDMVGNLNGYIGINIPATGTVSLDPLFDRQRRLEDLEVQRTGLLALVDALPPHPWLLRHPKAARTIARQVDLVSDMGGAIDINGAPVEVIAETSAASGVETEIVVPRLGSRTKEHVASRARRQRARGGNTTRTSRPAQTIGRATIRRRPPGRSSATTRRNPRSHGSRRRSHRRGTGLSPLSTSSSLMVVIATAVVIVAAAGYGMNTFDVGATGKFTSPPSGTAVGQFIYTARTADDAAITLPSVVQNALRQAGMAHQAIELTRVDYTGNVSTSDIDMTPRTGGSSQDPVINVAGRAMAAIEKKISGIESTVNTTTSATSGGQALYIGLTRTHFTGAPVTIISSGIDLSGPDDFRTLNWTIPPEQVVAAARKAGALPDLHGPVTFVVVPTAGPQPQLGQAQEDYLEAVWTDLLLAAGATFITFIDAEASTPPGNQKVTAPATPTVPIPALPVTPIAQVSQSNGVTCTVPDSYFIFKTAQLIDPTKTLRDLTPCIIAALDAHATFALDGWTSYTGPLNVVGKPAIDYTYNRTLSRAMVQAIANLLTNDLGVPRSAITRLIGHGNVDQPYSNPRGHANQVVVITYTID